MWPFGKKKEKEQGPKPEDLQQAQIQAFAQQFSPEEFTIIALTGHSAFAGNRSEESGLWTAGVTLSAWLREDEEEVHKEAAQLVTLADDRLFGYLRARIPANFILKVRVRAAKQGNGFQLIGMPEPGFDPDLKAMLEEQKKPVTLDGGDLGTFTLVRGAGWFDAEADWNGASTRLIFDASEEAAPCLDTARTLLSGAADWDEKVRERAAQKLYPQIQELAEEAGEDFSKEEFIEQLDPDSILVHGDGSFE
ncbi:MAG: DUF2262 domain-containing protein, partial [Oscillibacter sp.]|nr:DUF2262 domain-containing protein [Oscillibacter sp.]